jgi:hypothetical protein
MGPCSSISSKTKLPPSVKLFSGVNIDAPRATCGLGRISVMSIFQCGDSAQGGGHLGNAGVLMSARLFQQTPTSLSSVFKPACVPKVIKRGLSPPKRYCQCWYYLPSSCPDDVMHRFS